MWCEDLHAQPVLAVYAGYSLRQEYVNPGPDLDPYVQDALDEIEYVTGDASTKWGARRAADGHPAPFPLTYVEIGNEDFFDKSKSYDGRFAQFFNAIRKQYPNLKIIATTAVKSVVPDVVDDHFYRSAVAMEVDDHHYDKADRKGPKIFVGEWATREGSPTTNFNSALGDATWMTMMERNADLVQINSYAPLFVNVNENPRAWQWPSDLIGYNNTISFGSPSYYAQCMFAGNVGDHVVSAVLTPDLKMSATPPPPRVKPGEAPKEAKPVEVSQLHFVVTRKTADRELIIKMVNTSDKPNKVTIQLSGTDELKEGTATMLSDSDPKDTNDIDHPTKITPVDSKVTVSGKSFDYEFPGYSITVLRLKY